MCRNVQCLPEHCLKIENKKVNRYMIVSVLSLKSVRCVHIISSVIFRELIVQ